MILPIKTYGHQVLRQPAQPVTSFGGEIARLADNMADTMYAAPGIGLAAPQVGVGLRVVVVDVAQILHKPGILYQVVNPEIESIGLEMERLEEGCLSVPGFSEPVVRPRHVVIRGFDPSGQPIRIEADGLLARCFLHEIDHLEGILFVDRVVALRRALLKGKLKRHFGAISPAPPRIPSPAPVDGTAAVP